MAAKGDAFKWAVLFMLVFGTLMLNFSNMVFATRPTEVMAQFNMGQAELTAISGIGVLPGALFSIVLGNYFDRHGAKSIRFVGFALLVLAAGCQVWRVFADSYVQLFIITFLSGTFFLPTQVLPAKLIESWFEHGEMGTAMGIFGASAGLGICCAFAVGPLFPTITAALGFIAGGYVLVALLWLALAKMPDAPVGVEAVRGGNDASPASGASERVSVGAVLKSKTMWLVMVCTGLASGAPLLFNSYMVNAFVSRGMDPSVTSMLGVVFNISLVLGAVLSGSIARKIGRYNPVYLVFCLLGGVCIFSTYLAPVGTATFVLLFFGGLFSACSVALSMARVGLIPLTGEFGPASIGIAGGMNNTAMGVCMFILPTVAAVCFGDNYLAVFVTLLAFFVALAVIGGVLMPELGENGELAERARERR